MQKDDLPFVCRACIFTDTYSTLRSLKKPSFTHQSTQTLVCNTDCSKVLTELQSDIHTAHIDIKESKDTLNKVTQELSSLNEFLALSLPGPSAAKQALKMSEGMIQDSQENL